MTLIDYVKKLADGEDLPDWLHDAMIAKYGAACEYLLDGIDEE